MWHRPWQSPVRAVSAKVTAGMLAGNPKASPYNSGEMVEPNEDSALARSGRAWLLLERLSFGSLLIIYTLFEFSALWLARFLLTLTLDMPSDLTAFGWGFLFVLGAPVLAIVYRLAPPHRRGLRGAFLFGWVFLGGLFLQFLVGLSITLALVFGGIAVENGGLLWIDRLQDLGRDLESVGQEPQSPERRRAVEALYSEVRIWLLVMLGALAAMGAAIVAFYGIIQESGDSPLTERTGDGVATASILLLLAIGLILFPLGIWWAEPNIRRLRQCRSLVVETYRTQPIPSPETQSNGIVDDGNESSRPD